MFLQLKWSTLVSGLNMCLLFLQNWFILLLRTQSTFLRCLDEQKSWEKFWSKRFIKWYQNLHHNLPASFSTLLYVSQLSWVSVSRTPNSELCGWLKISNHDTPTHPIPPSQTHSYTGQLYYHALYPYTAQPSSLSCTSPIFTSHRGGTRLLL